MLLQKILHKIPQKIPQKILQKILQKIPGVLTRKYILLTGDLAGAGTDADVVLEVTGERGSYGPHQLHAHKVCVCNTYV
jgi:hypothetical protein